MKTGTKWLMNAALVTAWTMGGLALAKDEVAAGHQFGARREKFAALGLTDAQKAMLKETMQKHRATVKLLVDKLVVERRALQDLIHSGKADEAAVRAQSAKVAAAEAELAVARAQIAAALRPLLTEEQIKKLQEMKVKRRARVDGFRERIAKRQHE